jgi:hypothetical protein
MPLVDMIFILAAIGGLWWILTTYVPMPALVKRVITIVVVIGVGFWLLQEFGIIGSLRSVRVPRFGN